MSQGTKYALVLIVAFGVFLCGIWTEFASDLWGNSADAPRSGSPQNAYEIEMPASQAHSPAISLARYVSIGQGDTLRGPTPAGYWNLMISATSTADATIDTVTATCTFFDKAGAPIGNGGALFKNLRPGQKLWEPASVQSLAPPEKADCHLAVAYNLK